MVNLSLIERIKVIISIIKETSESKFVIPIALFIGLVLIISCSIRNKHLNRLYVIIYILLIAFLAYFYHLELLSLFDYLIENIVNNILFPNLAVYALMLLIVNVIVIKSILNKKLALYIKNINISFFVIMNLLLFFIVKNIIANDVNIYEKLTVYTNQNLLVLIEASMIIFVIWLLVLLMVKVVKDLGVKKLPQNEIYVPEVTNTQERKFILNFDDFENNVPELIEYIPIKKKRI